MKLNTFQKTAVITLCATFGLIFVGGLVRVAGAGLGCPDWPRCFGFWLPPFSAADLPDGYDPSSFNVFKTWMEYVNRLVGVIVGFFIMITFILSFRFFRTNTLVFFGAGAAFVLVLFQGWLGGQVVRSGLESWMITIHMVVAVVIINVLIWTVFRSMHDRLRLSMDSDLQRKLLMLLPLLIAVVVIQVIFGSQVREGIEEVRSLYPLLERGEWIANVGTIDLVHRSFSWLVLGLVASFQFLVLSKNGGFCLSLTAMITTIATLLQLILGAGLVYLDFPPAFQVFHLLNATIMTSAPFFALLIVLHSKSGAK
ncbi:MAG: COX15/CtaA family protein [Balneolales bacterium]